MCVLAMSEVFGVPTSQFLLAFTNKQKININFAKMVGETQLNLTINLDRLWAPNNIPLFDKLGRYLYIIIY